MARNNVKYTQATVQVSSTTYAANDLIGGKLTFEDAMPATGSAILRSMEIIDPSKTDADMQVLVFNEDINDTALTDNSSLDIASTDAEKLRTGIEVNNADWDDMQSQAHLSVRNLDVPLQGSGLYALLNSDGTPAFGDTHTLTITFGIEWLL